MKRIYALTSMLVFAALAFTGCGSSGPDSGSGSGRSPEQSGLKILAGSELKDIEPMIPQIEKATGVDIYFEYAGTLDGADQVASGSSGAAMAWFANSRYAQLLVQQDGSKALPQESLMRSPVVLGVKKSKAAEFGWDKNAVTWADIAQKSASGDLRFAMTNPASSNTGFAALMGVASATAGDANALNAGNVNDAALEKFFTGQKVTAGSSGYLAETYKEREDELDAIINYESVLLTLNNDLDEELTLVYPMEGIVTADYPLMLVDKAKKADYDKLVKYLKTPEVQKQLMEKTMRRPAVPGVALSSAFPAATLIELPFPSTLAVIDKILFSYLDKHTPPSSTYYVLDVSGSMNEEGRMKAMQKAMRNLTGVDKTATGRFTRFRANEKVTLIPFSSDVVDTQKFTITDPKPDGKEQQKIRGYVDGLFPEGGTAIYDALSRAYEMAQEDKLSEPERLYSVVLLTDGEQTDGMGFSEFEVLYRDEFADESVPTFTVLFGDSDNAEMGAVANLTNGRVFDGRGNLASIFKEIRGYQ